MKLMTLIGGVALGAVTFLVLQGCAFGRDEAGNIVGGFALGKLTETVNQGLTQLGDMLLPGLGAVAAAVGVPAIGWAKAAASAAAARAAHAAENRGFDEGVDRALGRAAVANPVGPSSPQAGT